MPVRVGLNHLRFHSWCPPEAAFCVADKLGFYLQVELPNWSYTIGKDEAMTQFLYNEFDRIVEAYGNHPSFCMMSVGNELQYDFKLLNDMVRYMKGKIADVYIQLRLLLSKKDMERNRSRKMTFCHAMDR